MDPTSDNLYGKLEAQLSTKMKTTKTMTRDDFAKQPTTEQQSSVGKSQRRQNKKKKRNVNVTPNQAVVDDRPQNVSEIQCIEMIDRPQNVSETQCIEMIEMIETMPSHIQEDRTPSTETLPEIPTCTNTHTNTVSVNVNIPRNPARAHVTTRPALTEEQRKNLTESLSRTVYIDGEEGDLVQLFKTKPRHLQKELVEKAGGPVDKVYRTDRGLKVIASTESQKKKLMAITMFNGKQVKVSLPFSLTRPHTTHFDQISQPSSQEANYFVKGIIHGLLESQENLDEIAGEIGAQYMKRIGRDPTTSKTTLIAYPKETILPPYIAIDGQRYKVHSFIPKPRRCDKCQKFGHSTDRCPNSVTCSRCSGSHTYSECPNKDTPKCANCFQQHSAAHRQCPVYIKTQEVLKVRAVEKVTYAQAAKRVEEAAKQPVASVIPVTLVTPNTPIPNLLTASATASNTQPSNDILDFTTQPIKEFLNINADKYKAVTSTTPAQDLAEDSHIQIANIITFVLGCLNTIDKHDTKAAIKNIICKVASEFLLSGNIKFCWRDIHN